MKKLIFGLTLLGSFLFINGGAMAQESVPGSGDGNSYGGVCCQTEDDCEHPKFGLVAESEWTSGISFCP